MGVRESDWTKLLGWPGYRVYQHEIDEHGKTLKLWVRRKHGNRKLHADLRPPRSMRPGQIARRDCQYQRCGTANMFCGVEPKAGRHFTGATPDRSSPEFAAYLLGIAEHYPGADPIHLVLDNLSSHPRKALLERFGEKAGGGCGIGSPSTTRRNTAVG